MSRPPFVPFDEHRSVRCYQRNLPHWRQDGCTYFVTFRLGDSIPPQVARGWEEEKRIWLEKRNILYDREHGNSQDGYQRLSPDERFRFEQYFNRQVNSCLDRGLGECHLRQDRCRAAVAARLLKGDTVDYHLGDFVLMPNHVHLLLTPIGTTALEDILKMVKGSTAYECNRLLGRSGSFWQTDSYDHIVRSLEQLFAYRKYIADNPRRAGLSLDIYRADWMDAWFSTGT